MRVQREPDNDKSFYARLKTELELEIALLRSIDELRTRNRLR